MHLYGLQTFVWKKSCEFQTSLKSLNQRCSNFIWSLLGAAEWKIAKMVAVNWPRWPPCPYMVKTFRKSFSPDQRMPWGWIFAQIIGDERSTKIAKMMVVHWRLTFLRRCQVCFRMHLYGPHTFVWKKHLIISNDTSSEASWPMWLKFHVEPPWGRGTKDC